MENRACNIHTYKFALQTQLSEKEFFQKVTSPRDSFFQKRISPRVSYVQTRSRQGISLSFRRKRKRGSDGTVFFENGLHQGELRSNAIPPRDKSVKTDHRQGGSAPSSRIKCTKGIRFQNRIDRTSSCHRQRRRFLFSRKYDTSNSQNRYCSYFYSTGAVYLYLCTGYWESYYDNLLYSFWNCSFPKRNE